MSAGTYSIADTPEGDCVEAIGPADLEFAAGTPAIGPLQEVAFADGGIYTVIARDALPGDAATDLGVILIDDTPVSP